METSDASEIRQVFFPNTDQIHIFPNPFVRKHSHISMQGMHRVNRLIVLTTTDMAGKTVYAERFFPDGNDDQ